MPHPMIKGHAPSQPDGQWRRSRSIIRAPSLRLLSRLLVILGCLSFVHFLGLHVRYRDALRAKYLPTEFLDFRDGQSNATQRLYSHVRGGASDAARSGILQDRHLWTRLGGGREGDAFLYKDSVIKVYNERSSPFRNCVPTEDATLRWPTEIAATIIMGGPRRNMTDGDMPPDSPENAFIPVQDFFHAAPRAGAPRQWHLVTPFLRAGTLKKLATATNADASLSFRDVDRRYRPSFEFLLAGLDRLHNEHDLCHDDIKPDNIFVASPESPEHWVLADLGNARQPAHPYHSSLLWTSDTPQHPDCKLNDVVRLTKTYLAFVRAASADATLFDASFFSTAEPLAALYWGILHRPAPAMEVRERSHSNRSLKGVVPADGTQLDIAADTGVGTAVYAASFFIGRRRALAIAVSRHLRVGASETKGRFFGLSWLMGIPVLGCQAAA